MEPKVQGFDRSLLRAKISQWLQDPFTLLQYGVETEWTLRSPGYAHLGRAII